MAPTLTGRGVCPKLLRMSDLSRFDLGRPTLTMRTVETLKGRLDILEGLVRKGVRNPLVRAVALEIVSRCPDRNDRCEIEQLFWYVKGNVRYTQDIFGIDTYQAPARTLQWKGGDCLPGDTWLLGEAGLVPLSAVKVGQRIWGLNDWTTVEAAWSKGVLPVDRVQFGSASVLATSDHKFFVRRCAGHDTLACGCPAKERSIVRVRGRDLTPGTMLVTPERKPHGDRFLRAVDVAWPRVTGIDHGVAEVECYDLTTTDHYVYLPEADVTVSNCDDHVVLLTSLLSVIGYQTGFRVISVNGQVWEHIYGLVGLPKGSPSPGWKGLDTTIPSATPGWEPGVRRAVHDRKPLKLI